MISFSLIELKDVLGDQLITITGDPDVSFEGVGTDSRGIQSSMLFAALQGDRVDGHDYAQQAMDQGASALMVERLLPADIPQVQVKNVLFSLGRLAAAWCTSLGPKVVAITGSNGKTTVKEMVAAILAENGAVLSTQGNYNNELGLPLTLFRLSSEHQYAVLEMGASKAGDIAYLCSIAKPHVAVITNVGPAHLDGFGSEQGVATAKGEIYQSLAEDGCAVINADQDWNTLWKELADQHPQTTFGNQGGLDIYPELTDQGVTIHTPKGSFPLQLSLPGEHNRMNAMAATGICLALGLSVTTIARGLEKVQPVPGRLNVLVTDKGWTVIDDTYNANPASLYAALRVLTDQPGEKWLVLGDMKELGAGSRKLHAELGDAAASLGVSRLFTVGEMSAFTANAFGEQAVHFEDRTSLIAHLRPLLHPGVSCLVKGSRSMGMEAVVEAITNTQEKSIKEAG